MDSGRVFFLQTGAKSKVNEASQKRSLEFEKLQVRFGNMAASKKMTMEK